MSDNKEFLVTVKDWQDFASSLVSIFEDMDGCDRTNAEQLVEMIEDVKGWIKNILAGQPAYLAIPLKIHGRDVVMANRPSVVKMIGKVGVAKVQEILSFVPDPDKSEEEKKH